MNLVHRVRVLAEPPSNVTNFLQQRRLREFMAAFPPGARVGDIGSGHNKYSDRVIGIDILFRHDVDVCGNIYALPLADDSLDGIVIRGVLEHIEFPERAVAELERVLRPGGRIYASIPFMQAYHPSPGDFQRYTIDGIRRLFAAFDCEACTITRGAGSSYLWIGREYFAQLFSLNSVRLYKVLKVLFGWLMQPFKYTDVVLNRHPMAHVAASGFTFVGRKRERARCGTPRPARRADATGPARSVRTVEAA